MSAVIAELGYLAFEVSDLEAWEAFAHSVLGVMVTPGAAPDERRLRTDGRTQRILLKQGPADDLLAMGWIAQNEEALAEVCARLKTRGIAVEEGSVELCASRSVRRIVRFEDIAGVPVEVALGPEAASTPFASKRVVSSFVTGDMGVGHVVISADDQAASREFYEGVFGLLLSDHIRCEFFGHKVDLAFMHVNGRHHSLAFGGRQKHHLHHFMLEVAAMDDVGLCYDRALRKGVRIMNTLGRHPNDRMFSYYGRTPSGFQFEFGCGGRVIDDATWEPVVHDRISEWGHHPPMMLAGPPRKPKGEAR